MLTPTWLTHIWEYLYSCNATINEKDLWLYIPPRDNDFFLMDLIIEAAIPDEHKIIFNEIRMHLKLITAADIVQINSNTQILPNIIQGKNSRGSTYKWPDTKPFPKKWIKIWQATIDSYIVP